MAKAKTLACQKTCQETSGKNYAFGLFKPGELIELDNYGFVPTKAEVTIPGDMRKRIKGLALTLDSREDRLNDGSLIKGSVPKTLIWIAEKFIESLDSKPINPKTGKQES